MVFPAIVQAKKTTYVFTDRKFNFVKRVELKKKELQKRGKVNHPYAIDPMILRKNLSEVQVSRKILLSEKVEESHIFNNQSLENIVPHLIQAFAEATIQEEVAVSFLKEEKNNLVRDDRLTILKAWIVEDKLVLKFQKLMAKVPNSYDRIGDVQQAINRSQGLRVSLDLQPGQEYGESTDELVLNLKLVVGSASKKEPLTVPETPPVPDANKPETNNEGRLVELKQLKDKGLITEKEYDQKREEILKKL